MTEFLYLLNGVLVVGFAWLWVRQQTCYKIAQGAIDRIRAQKKDTAEWITKHAGLHHNTAQAIAGRFKDIHGRVSDEVRKSRRAT